MNICVVVGCGKARYGHGWCNMHYMRWKRHGDPLIETRSLRGTGTTRPDGYRVYRLNGKNTLEHVKIVEKALGHKLPSKAVIHHVDGDPSNNTHSNLIVCNDQAYHRLIHQRTAAWIACSNANWRKCPFCKQYDDLTKLQLMSGGAMAHPECRREYKRNYKKGSSV